MKYAHTHIALGIISFITFTNLHAQQTYTVSGSVQEKGTNEILAGVNIIVKGTTVGTITNDNGEFFLDVNQLPAVLIFSFVGFQPAEVNVTDAGHKVNVALEFSSLLAQEIVVTASRLEESILKSPVAIEKLDLRALKESPSSSFYDALENLKGVQMTTSSLTFKVPNTRGFNIPNNFRFMQLVDGVDMQAATLGVPLGNAIGPTELDIESVEVIPGATSVLYGMNAINGMASLQTKNPFDYQGLSIYQKTGVNHVDGIDRSPSVLTETAIRFAKAYNDKFAFKFNVSYLQGTDWLSNTATDQNPNTLSTANPLFEELSGASNPAYDGWNNYGDENNNAVTVSGVQYEGKSQTFLVRRTGYWEKDLTNPIVENAKIDGSLHYRLSKKTELSYTYRWGKMDGVFQRGNKIQLDDVTVQNHKVELKGESFLFRGYISGENTGNSYNLKPLADNIQLTALSNSAWRDKFKTALQTGLNNGTDLASGMQEARTVADATRLDPGSKEFDDLKNTIVNINNWDHGAVIAGAPATGGAWLKQSSRMYHVDAQWDLSNQIKIFNLLVGGDARVYEVIPDGNNFVDFSRPVEERNQPLPNGTFGNSVYYKKYGVFAQGTKILFDEKLKLTGSLRVDHNTEFEPKLNPRVAAVYTPAENHNFRASYQNGFRFPALFEALSFVNNGNVRRVGGLPFINEGLGYLDNSYTLSSVNRFNAAVNTAVDNGASAENAALANRDMLVKSNLSAMRPERINAFEIGYKGLLSNTLSLDVDIYTSSYDGFLGQVEVSVPNSGIVGSDEAVIDMLTSNRASQNRYRVFTNANNVYRNYGAALGISSNFYKTLMGSFNVTYNNITENDNADVFVTAFNTPNWVTNITIGNRELTKHMGFNIVWHWQESYVWQSPLANGKVPAYNTFDAQVTYKIPSLFSTLKVGGSNILNQRYIQYAAGPNIGALYYVTLTVDGLLKK